MGGKKSLVHTVCACTNISVRFTVEMKVNKWLPYTYIVGRILQTSVFTTRAVMSSRVTCRVCLECVTYNHVVGLFTKQEQEQRYDDDRNDVVV